MATNSGRPNNIGAPEGLEIKQQSPPPLSKEVRADITDSTASSSVHASGQDAGAASNAPASVEAPPQGKNEHAPAGEAS
ncbi:hypothetical protein BN1723_010622 [Verticillium longisporum]|uniref:Uncharacterized protein n=1 Tax=Verticillium longisporum TaxID=100787 RepID=A0A0G4KZZ7_VERLO|nr:hypothetical protein HYQ44_002294 [Verticillium longisporum]KAG7146415.1 hypothetical protein HYQ46_004793 [Verticillium longisporum]CRK15329.1 hypothetical protein BN1723_010622 [Verticillium longisporum]CRK28966.1 hypothetical protein BN1708_015426 [Verticillium longisporum]